MSARSAIDFRSPPRRSVPTTPVPARPRWTSIPKPASRAAAGYVVIRQDVRGRFDSEGEFYPFRHEAEDGYDAVEWAAALPYSNGQVGMWGGSYVGATQMLAASAHPPHLVAIFPYVTASEYYEGWTYQHGALMQWFATSWSSGLAIDTLRRQAQAREQKRLLDWG